MFPGVLESFISPSRVRGFKGTPPLRMPMVVMVMT